MYAMQELDELSALVCAAGQQAQAGAASLATASNQVASLYNAEHVAPPRPGGTSWAPTAIREMLLREDYRGTVRWNRIAGMRPSRTASSRYSIPQVSSVGPSRSEQSIGQGLRHAGEEIGRLARRIKDSAPGAAHLTGGQLLSTP